MNSITLSHADIELLLEGAFLYVFLGAFSALVVYDFLCDLPWFIRRIYRFFRKPEQNRLGENLDD